MPPEVLAYFVLQRPTDSYYCGFPKWLSIPRARGFHTPPALKTQTPSRAEQASEGILLESAQLASEGL